MCSPVAAASPLDMFLASNCQTSQTAVVDSFQLHPLGKRQPWPAAAPGLRRTVVLTLIHLDSRAVFWLCGLVSPLDAMAQLP